MLSTKLYTEVSKDLQIHIAVFIYKEWPDLYVNKDISEIVESFKNLHKCWVFYNNEDIVGTAGINIDTPVPTFNTNYWICNLFVLPEYRKKGYGKYILDYTENYLNKQGISIAHLYCNEDLLDFYKRNAWNVSDDNVPDRPLSKIMIKML